MSKKVDITYFDVVSMDGLSGLVVHNKDSYELLIEEIDEIVAKAQAAGYYNDEKWLIISVRLERSWSEDGMLLMERITKMPYAKYDNGLVVRVNP